MAVQKSATFKMYGGAISGNHSDSAGGGVAVQKDGSFEMYGGSITGNSAATYGGGVYDNVAYVTLYGGSITGNTAGTQGGGIYNAGKEDDSVYKPSDKKITLYPTRGSRITVTGNTVNGAANNLATHPVHCAGQRVWHQHNAAEHRKQDWRDGAGAGE